MDIRGVTTSGESGEHGHHVLTNFGSIKDLGQGVLYAVVIVIVADESILIASTGSDGIYAC